MILTWLTSAGNNIVDKTKNPFLGTFTLVWLARNWELIFALFNFDKSYSLEKKIKFLSERIQYDTFWTEVGYNILWTFIVLILTYLLVNITRVISNLFEKRLTPIVHKWTDYKSLVPKSEYQGVLTRMNDIQERLDKEIQEKIKLQNERDKLEENIQKLNIEIINLEDKPKPEQTEKTESRKLFKDSEETLKTDLSEMEQKLVSKYGADKVFYVLDLILKNKTIFQNTEYTEVADTLENFEFIVPDLSKNDGIIYGMRPSGKRLWKKLFE